MHPRRNRGFTLVEILTVVAIVVLVVSLLLPSLGRAKALSKQAVCTSNLHQLGIAMSSYLAEGRGWIPGSPNTTGWGSYAANSPGEPDDYKEFDYPQRPISHVYDWSTPLSRMMMRQESQITSQQVQNRKNVFQCPAVPSLEVYSEFSKSYQDVPSYLTDLYFLVSIPGGGKYKEFGYSGKSSYLPQFRPRVDLIGPPGRKVYLADGTKYRTMPGRLLQEHSTNGFTCYGAWRNRPLDSALQAYRDPNLLGHSYRHPGGINALFFDGHAEALSEAESRLPGYWFPTGTNTQNLPGRVTAEEALIVP